MHFQVELESEDTSYDMYRKGPRSKINQDLEVQCWVCSKLPAYIIRLGVLTIYSIRKLTLHLQE